MDANLIDDNVGEQLSGADETFVVEATKSFIGAPSARYHHLGR